MVGREMGGAKPPEKLSGCLGKAACIWKLGAGCVLGFQVALVGAIYAEVRYFHGAREGNAVTALPFDFGVAG